MDNTTCCGLCDTDICHNTDCQKWKKKEAEEMKRFLFELMTAGDEYLND